MSYKVAGIDVHKKVLMVVVVGWRPVRPQWKRQRRRFGTTTSELRQLADWLREQGVEEAVMESTAQYWKPVWYELEPYMRLQLAQAFSNRAPRGRKHDFRDAERLVRRLVANELILSFVPQPEQRAWRTMTRMKVPTGPRPGAAAQSAGVSAGGDADQAVQCAQRSAGGQRAAHSARLGRG